MNNNNKISLQENKINFIIERGAIRFAPLRDSHHTSRFHDKVRNNNFKITDNSKELLEF